MDERGMEGIRPLAAFFIILALVGCILALVGCAQPAPGQGQTAYAPYSDDNSLHVRGSEGGGAGGM